MDIFSMGLPGLSSVPGACLCCCSVCFMFYMFFILMSEARVYHGALILLAVSFHHERDVDDKQDRCLHVSWHMQQCHLL